MTLKQPSTETLIEDRSLYPITALFADISGFTTLSKQYDPVSLRDVTQNIFKKIRTIILSYGGIVEHYLGDCVFAIFNSDCDNNNHACCALLAALEIISITKFDKFSPAQLIQLHIGINTGEVAIGTIETDTGIHCSFIGDTINIAAKLCEAAPSGSVFVGQKTYAVTSEHFNYIHSGTITLPIQDRNITIHQLSGWNSLNPPPVNKYNTSHFTISDKYRSSLLNNVGVFHRHWFNHPLIWSITSFGFVCLICFSAMYLGIWNSFGEHDRFIGFNTPNWGFLFLWALPLTIILTSTYFRFCSNALLSLDHIVKPRLSSTTPFSNFIVNEFKRSFKKVVPACFILTVLIVFIADGLDIISPLNKSRCIASKGWTTMGYIVNSMKPASLYFAFNIAAFTLEGFLIYCTQLLLSTEYFVMVKTIHYLIILERSRTGKQLPSNDNSTLAIIRSFRINWDWKEKNGRYGLHEFDKVFLISLICISCSLILVSISIGCQVITSFGSPDIGSWIGLVCTAIGFPIAINWLISPYLHSLPDLNSGHDNIDRYPHCSQWPFGNRLLTLSILGIDIAAWAGICMVCIILSIRKIL